MGYHQTVSSPICLADVLRTHEAGGYDSYAAFAADIDTLISNSFYFNDEDSIEWIGTCMLQADLNAAKDALKATGLARLLADPSAAGAHEPPLALTDQSGAESAADFEA